MAIRRDEDGRGGGDGSAGDADYGAIGAGYAQYRRPEPRIAALIEAALGDAGTVLNVGAGAGSYEPRGRAVTAVEPSATMRAQRPADLPPAIDAVAESLPFPDGAFDAAMATFTVHQWRDLGAGLAEMRRVTRGPVAILSCDPDAVADFWLNDYAPEVLATEARRYPPIAAIAAALGGTAAVLPVPIPLDCRDGFNEAYYGRPERLLEDGARLACSAWSFVAPAVRDRAVAALRRDLVDGTWDARHGALRTRPEFHGSLRLVVARP
ncbi:class I SAM-dependent methyltransferase [Roseomonas sp. NAR14]|uniref:Class I SAM-dependent methyltransferase n=1 Tax=Roseomonas acroporae TaxID=2937791 RepID=A0A9X2BW42_9PROT|nr:class I SAM-dependent methyltransferase [Roseomonas acroporae]MCK8783450.1 class I SAM-dependent methyltransferase [Roseomonas acroporae]